MLRFLAAFLLLSLFSTSAMAVNKVVVVGLFKDRAILSIDGKQRLLKAGETSPEGVQLISANSREAVLEIDGERDTYKLGTHISSQFSEPEEGEIVRLWPNPSNGLYIADGSINGFSMKFVVDTGASLVSMNSHVAKRLGINYRLEGNEGLAQTASGFSKIYIIELESVRVGDIVLSDVKASVHEGDHPTRVLLGNSFLERITLRRDGKMLELQGPP